MAEEEKPKIPVDAATVVEAIITEKWNKTQTARFNKQGIYRLNEAELKQKLPQTKDFSFAEGELTTVLQNVAVINKEVLVFKDNNNTIPDVYITACELGAVEITNCKWDRPQDLFMGNTNFYIEKSTTGDFIIEGASTTGDFIIEGASTTGYFWIKEKSTTGYFIIEGASTTGDFIIEGASTTGDFIIEGASTTGDFWIKEKSTTGDFIIEGASTTGDFIIEGASTTGYFSISGASTTGYFSISGASTTGYFSISGASTTGDFWIKEKSTTGYFSIEGASTTGDFSISGRSTTGDFSILDESKTGSVWINDSYTGDLTVKNGTAPLWEIKNCFASFTFSKAGIAQCKLINCQIPQLHIQNQCEMELYVSGGSINHLNFEQLTLGKNSIVSLSSVKLYLCNMFEFTVLGNLYFRDIGKAENTIHFFNEAKPKPEYILRTDEEYNRKPNENNTAWKNYYAKIKSYRKHIKELKSKLAPTIKPTPTFRIVKSSLAKTEFTECDLKDFRVEYKHSKLTEVFMSGGSVPDDDLVIYKANENDLDPKKQLEWHEQKAAFFNQLKKVFSQMGNVYRETQYNSLSAKHQLQILRINRRIAKGKTQNGSINRFINAAKPAYIWLKTRLPGSNSFDIITFYLNRFSNNHGASWGRAVVFTLLSTLCAYIVYLCSVKVLGFGKDYVFAFDWELVAYYFSFIDITHKPDFMDKYNGVTITANSRIISFFSRILVGFCIYQFIAAFRRHGKQG